MIAALEDQDAGAAGEGLGQRQGHEVGLGARIGEAEPLDRGEAIADEPRQFGLHQVMGAEAPAGVEGAVDGRADDGVGMAIEAGGELAQKVEVAVPIRIPEEAAFAARHDQGKRLIEQHGAGIAAGHDRRGAGMGRRTERVAIDIGGAGLGQGRLDGIRAKIETIHHPHAPRMERG